MKEYRPKKVLKQDDNKNKKRLNKKYLIIPIGLTVVLSGIFICGNTNKDDNLITNTMTNSTIEAEEIKPPENPKEPEKTKEQIAMEKLSGYGIGINGIDSAYNAKVIRDKLQNYDYSNDGDKIVFLTFDDGSSVANTPTILKTLKDENVKATFFLNGKAIENGGEKAKDIVKQTYDEGHAIANHSYSHDYKILYPNRNLDINAFKEDFNKTDEILKDIIGKEFKTRVMRCPGGEMSWKGMSALETEYDKISIDWNALTKDSEGKKKVASELVQECINTSQGKEIVVLLMHDIKSETAKALPDIIKYFKDNGYDFKTLV